MNFYALYYSNNRGNPALLDYCLRRLEKSVQLAGGGLVTVTWLPVVYGHNILYGGTNHACHRTMYQQIRCGLNQLPDGVPVFLCEHDVLYPSEYFTQGFQHVRSAPGTLVYNRNVWMLNYLGFFKFMGPYVLTSNCSAMPEILRHGCERKLAECAKSPVDRPTWAEFKEETAPITSFESSLPVVDIRHDGNFTGMRYGEEPHTQLSPWGLATRFTSILGVLPE